MTTVQRFWPGVDLSGLISSRHLEPTIEAFRSSGSAGGSYFRPWWCHLWSTDIDWFSISFVSQVGTHWNWKSRVEFERARTSFWQWVWRQLFTSLLLWPSALSLLGHITLGKQVRVGPIICHHNFSFRHTVSSPLRFVRWPNHPSHELRKKEPCSGMLALAEK